MKRVSIKTLSDSSIHIKEEPNGDHVLLSTYELNTILKTLIIVAREAETDTLSLRRLQEKLYK